MSIRAMIQIGVQLDSFKNISLSKQGFYQLRVTVYHATVDNSRVSFILYQTYFAYPFSLLSGEKVSNNGKGKSCDYHEISPARIFEESSIFYSRLFMIRYSDETVELQDFCQFRTEIDISPNRPNDPCYANIGLYFGDIASVGPPELFDSDVICKRLIGF